MTPVWAVESLAIGRPGEHHALVRVYCAGPGPYHALEETETLALPQEEPVRGYPNVLISYFYDTNGRFFTETLDYRPAFWMGDSGAFSAWTRGEQIDLARYIEWCKTYRALYPNFVCVSLDVIAGSREAHPSRREAERAMQQSLENGDLMRAAGLKIMEVHHQLEPLAYLDLLLERRQPGEVLGISPRDNASATQRQRYCDIVFAHLRESCGWQALVPVHGLGVNPLSPLAQLYPWWSVDASTWVASAMYGREVLPGGKKGGADARNSNRALRMMYLVRTLNAWLERELILTQVWQERGIRFSDTPYDQGGALKAFAATTGFGDGARGLNATRETP